MAKEDYNVADRPNAGLTAGEHVEETVQDTPDADAAAFATAGGVSSAAFRNYATALNAFQARDDIETLADRRAREYGDGFNDAEFMRQEAYNADGTAADAPRPGTVYGDADKSA